MLIALALAACTATHHDAVPGPRSPAPSADFEALIDVPGPLRLETVASADWEVDLSGLLDLDDPKAVAAGLVDRKEPIQIFFHAIEHPERGLFVVDTGVETALRDDPENAAIRGIVASAMHAEDMTFHAPLGEWLGGHPLAGVLLTHLHLDHVSGMGDVPPGTPVWTGPGEVHDRSLMNLFVRGSTDRALAGVGDLQEWTFDEDPSGRFAGVVDVFGDGSLWALSTPGHTTGSVAYLARTVDGPVLMTGDSCHTRWGWDHDVAPGSFTGDAAGNADSLARLRKLAADHPGVSVRLGHQR